VHPDVLPLVLVPDATLSTHVARGLLPGAVPHADAAYNAGRAAMLVLALTREPGLLLEATEDRLHQRQRTAAMPESLALMDRLRAAGLPAVVSGAGPSLLVLTQRHPDDEPLRKVSALTPPGWTVLPLEVDTRGARVLHGDGEVSSR
jgi:homoserine kinase